MRAKLIDTFGSYAIFLGQGAKLPLATMQVDQVGSWSGNAVKINQTSAVRLAYPDIQANNYANIVLRQGTVRFWF